MATYVEIYNLYDAVAILAKTTVAVLKIADYIITTEGAEVTNHANRVTWATAALQDPRAKAREMLWAVLSNGDVQTGGTSVADATIQYVVETRLNDFAKG